MRARILPEFLTESQERIEEGGSGMAVEETKRLVRRYVEEGVIKVAQGDVAAIHEFLADDFMNHTPLLHDSHAKGKEHMVTNIQEGGNALPDLRMTADIIVAE